MNDDWIRLDDVLHGLPGGQPDAKRSNLVRERCHRKLTRRPIRRTVETVIVGGFCAAYVTIGAFLALYYRGLH